MSFTQFQEGEYTDFILKCYIDPTWLKYKELGNQEFKKKNYSKAIEHYTTAVLFTLHTSHLVDKALSLINKVEVDRHPLFVKCMIQTSIN